MSLDTLRELVNQHSQSVRLLTAIGVALNANADACAHPPELVQRATDILRLHGLDAVVSGAEVEQLVPILASIKSDVLFGASLLSSKSASRGWNHHNEDLLQAFGNVSAGFPALLRTKLAPMLRGLSETLSSPGCRFLDVGTGVGALSINMLKDWPTLTAVGIEPNIHASRLAKQNAEAANVLDRFEIITGAGQDLVDDAGFDLIWVPSAFIPLDQLKPILLNVKKLLRTGGWIIIAALIEGRCGLDTSLDAFRVSAWGGSLLGLETWEELLLQADLPENKVLPGPPASPIIFIAATE